MARGEERQRFTDRWADRLAGASGYEDPPTIEYEVLDDETVLAAPSRRQSRTQSTFAKMEDRFPPGEELAFVRHQHEIVLAIPLLRTVVAVLPLIIPSIAAPCLIIFALTALASIRLMVHTWKWRLIALGGLLVAGLIFGNSDMPIGSRVGVGIVLALWFLLDFLDWRHEVLVVSTARVYRFYGIITSHSPSVALTGVAFIDPEVPPLGKLFGYGTLNLDSAAQRDQPLSAFPFLPDVVDVQRRILELRTSANRKMYAGRNGAGDAGRRAEDR